MNNKNMRKYELSQSELNLKLQYLKVKLRTATFSQSELYRGYRVQEATFEKMQ